MKRFLAVALLLTIIVITVSFALQKPEELDMSVKVNDLTSTLHQNEIDHITSKLNALQSNKGSQFFVIIIPTTEDETIEQYGVKLSQLKKPTIDNGVLLLIAKQDRQVSIEIINSLEHAISEDSEKRIIEEIIVPQFRSGDFYHGLDQGVDAIISLVNGEQLPIPHAEDSHPTASNGKAIYLVLFPFAFILLTVINYLAKKKLGKAKGALITPIILFIAGWWFINIIGGILTAVFSLIFLNIPGGRGQGGSRYDGGRYYGSSGGYSIGGGSFKGGGASGSW